MIQVIDLPYAYSDLEAAIDSKTVEIHYEKHHKGYLNNLLNLIKGKDCENWSLEELVKKYSSLDQSIQTGVRNNAGGVINHNLYWSIMSKTPKSSPEGKLLDSIKRDFDSFDNFKEVFIDSAKKRFGSGWAFLVADKDKNLKVYSLPNQDSPLSNGDIPLVGLDVWEHAYYLKYQNKRPDYIDAFFKVLNWESVEKIYNGI